MVNTLIGAASDDSGVKQPNTAGTTGAPAAAPPAGSSTNPTPQPNSTTGSAPADKKPTGSSAYQYQASIVSSQPVNTTSQPGKRLQNPLGEFSSCTYQLTLYMITPDAYTAFVNSGRTKINILKEASQGKSTGGAFIIAQSGGVSDPALRAPGFTVDYGIDNLVIHNFMNGKSTTDATNAVEVTFTITEPYGFSFLSNLRKAGDAMMNYQNDGNYKGPKNHSREFFVLGIRFLGYDASGRVMLPNTKMSSGTGVVDPLSQTGSLFEYFLDININQIRFKIDGKAVQYHVEAVQASQAKAFNTSRGFIKTDKPVEAGTVGEFLDKLVAHMNEEQLRMSQTNPPSLLVPNKYQIVWLPGSEDILNASLISPARNEKSRWTGSGAKTIAGVNVATDTKTQAANSTKKIIQITSGTPIVQAINNVIVQSSYLDDALHTLYTAELQADPTTKSDNKIQAAKTASFGWYTCTPQITDIKWDELTKDWAYTISYLIQKYDTPAVDVAYDAITAQYPGPVKRYDYWYTGENREILKYEQIFDNLYFNTVVSAGDTVTTNNTTGTPAGGTVNQSGSTSQTPKQPGMLTNNPRQGAQGYDLEAQHAFMTALYDPNAYAKAEITILGDPDFLTVEPTYSPDQVYDKFYGGNGYCINTNGSQVFIEIDFKEGVDYTSQTGTMNINSSILFWQYPPELAKKIHGVCYQVVECVNTFVNGMFKQTLSCVLPEFGNKSSQIASATQAIAGIRSENANITQQTVSAVVPKNNAASGQGTVADNPTTPGVATTAVPTPSNNTAAVPVNTKGIANGDGKSTNSTAKVTPGR